MNTDVMFSSKTDEWATPQDLFDYLNSIYHFTLDVCANEINHKCSNYYTKEDDGLKQSWDGVFWMNPPYGRVIYQWVKKAFEEAYKPNRNNVGVLLLPARTDTKWFHEFCAKGTVIFVKGRLKFNEGKNSAPFPSMIVVFDGHMDPFDSGKFQKGNYTQNLWSSFRTIEKS